MGIVAARVVKHEHAGQMRRAIVEKREETLGAALRDDGAEETTVLKACKQYKTETLERSNWKAVVLGNVECGRDHRSELAMEEAGCAESRGDKTYDRGSQKDSLWERGARRQVPGGLIQRAGEGSDYETDPDGEGSGSDDRRRINDEFSHDGWGNEEEYMLVNGHVFTPAEDDDDEDDLDLRARSRESEDEDLGTSQGVNGIVPPQLPPPQISFEEMDGELWKEKGIARSRGDRGYDHGCQKDSLWDRGERREVPAGLSGRGNGADRRAPDGGGGNSGNSGGAGGGGGGGDGNGDGGSDAKSFGKEQTTAPRLGFFQCTADPYRRPIVRAYDQSMLSKLPEHPRVE